MKAAAKSGQAPSPAPLGAVPKSAPRTPQFELFLPYLADLHLRDQREMMERPFFSLAKSKRLKPIDYRSPDGKTWVHVSGNPDYGMATIWDADILIYCASVLADMQRRGVNDIPRRLKLMPYDLLRAIDRPTTGRAYELLGASLDRLTSTTVKTNIRAENRREATFNWLDGWEQIVDEKTERSRGITIDLSNWFYDGVLMSGGVLAIDRAYFSLTGGRERWLYKVARKHAGGAGEAGFSISLPTLFEKSGAEGDYRRFKFELAKIARRDALPGYTVKLQDGAGRGPSLLMTRRAATSASAAVRPPTKSVPVVTEEPTVDVGKSVKALVASLADRANAGFVADSTRAQLRQECPGWDLDQLHTEFKGWIGDDAGRTPVNYQAAFIGFVRRHHAREKHTL